MLPKYRIGTIIVCDDVRVEVSGKETLVGVYNGVVVIPSFPATMAKLCFRLPIYADHPFDASMTFQVYSPSKKKLIEIKGDASANPSDAGHELPFGFAIGNLSLPEPGEYEVRFCFGPAKPKRVSSFLVRQPRPGDPGREFPPAARAVVAQSAKSKRKAVESSKPARARVKGRSKK